MRRDEWKTEVRLDENDRDSIIYCSNPLIYLSSALWGSSPFFFFFFILTIVHPMNWSRLQKWKKRLWRIAWRRVVNSRSSHNHQSNFGFHFHIERMKIENIYLRKIIKYICEYVYMYFNPYISHEFCAVESTKLRNCSKREAELWTILCIYMWIYIFA